MENIAFLTTLPTSDLISTKNVYDDVISQSKKVTDSLKSAQNSIKKDEIIQQRKQSLRIAGSSAITSLVGQLSQNLNKLASLNSQIEVLVDNTNEIISNIKTKDDIEKAKIARNNTLRVINDAETRLLNINNTLSRVNSLISIFQIIVNILSALPTPTSVPPGVGIPINIIIKLSDKFSGAKDTINQISIVLAIINPIINELLNNLNEQRQRLNNIGNLIDNNAIQTINSEDLSNFFNSSNFGKLGLLDNVSYKDFKFAIKEENNPKFVVQGHKRRFAVAINKDGNEILKSESSFTLDPDILIQELRLTIDQKQLKA